MKKNTRITITSLTVSNGNERSEFPSVPAQAGTQVQHCPDCQLTIEGFDYDVCPVCKKVLKAVQLEKSS